ncbi:hypothetical protein ACHAXA_002751 [Cyclostephanos tholiformis]|uniref:Uncharacterized protein n=1 Tax=Cyclostephanos tholiformis TaxID=382380 RepID=A0ABD3RDU2_9STRA
MKSTCHRRQLLALAIVVAAGASNGADGNLRGLGWKMSSPVRSSSSSSLSRRDHRVHKLRRRVHPSLPAVLSLRCGSTSAQRDAIGNDDDDDDDEGATTTARNVEDEDMQRKTRDEHEKLARYRAEQHLLYQLRSTYLTEILASRGLPNLPTLSSVSTSDGDRPPEKVDWDCALCTDDEPRSCLYSFDAEPYTKVVAPRGTDHWISLSALNRLRRTDATKVEPMWHSRYSILSGWFSESSEYCMLQHVGIKGFFLSSVLLDGANGMVLRSLLILSAFCAFVLFLPIIEYVVGRILVSAPFWSQWTTWGRILRAGFPLKLLLGQMAWKGIASSFAKVENAVREYIIDMECDILEECVPVTVGAGSEEGGGVGEVEDEGDDDVVGGEVDNGADSEENDEYDEDIFDDEH